MTFALVATVGFVPAVAAVTALSSIRAGQAAEAQGEYVAAQNEVNAQQARSQASSMEDEQRLRARQIIGSQVAAGAESGVQLSGSASDLLRQSLFNAEADAQQIRYEGENRARGFIGQAAASRLEGRNARRQGNISAFGSLMSGAGRAYGGK